jgi:hypothetical protein
MSGCERFEELLERYLAGDIEPADLEVLHRHAQACPKCRQMMQLHQQLSTLPGQAAWVPDERFDEMRASVLDRIRSGAAVRGVPGSPKREPGAPDRSSLPFLRRWSPVLIPQPIYAVAVVIALLALGFVAGRVTAVRTGGDESLLVKEVVRQASQERGLAGYWDSPFIYSNVSFRPRDDGTVAIDFDATRHVAVTRKLESPLTREILVHAMLDPSTMGARFNAMGVAGQAMDEKLREALVFILRNDPSLPVRLRALETLAAHASERDVQDALLAALAQDPSVQIRLLAVECLAGRHTDPGLIRNALGEPRDDNDRAVLLRATELLGDS